MGIKEATGDVTRVAQLRAGCGSGFGLYSGDDATAREFILAGGDGVVSVTANVAPSAMAKLCAAAAQGDTAAAAAIDVRLDGLHRELFIESNPIPVKWALARMGLIENVLRLPLTTLSPQAQPAVEAALHQARLL
jgi:4-hydroxy-tetrahydrodipicolinate synthase